MKRLPISPAALGPMDATPDQRTIAKMLCDFQRAADESLLVLKEIRELLREAREDGKRYSAEAKVNVSKIEKAMKHLPENPNANQ